MVTNRLGEIIRDGDRVGVRFERQFRHAPDRVWRALTASDELHHWFPCDIVGRRENDADVTTPYWPEVVAKFSDRIPPDAVFTGRILTWDPPHVFEWLWGADRLRYELTATTYGTHMDFTVWIGEGPSVEEVAAGYHVCFDCLDGVLHGGHTGTVADGDPTAFEPRYRDHFGQ